MAQLECTDPSAEGQVTTGSADLRQISSILGKHDTNGAIAQQVDQCLQNDGVTLSLLSDFDDYTLKEMIDSWNLNTFNKKSFLIRGILINGIKRMRNSHNLNSPSDSTDTNNQTQPIGTTIMTEKELAMYKSMIEAENMINKIVSNLENENKMQEEKRNENLQESIKEIENKIGEIRKRLNECETRLTNEVKQRLATSKTKKDKQFNTLKKCLIDIQASKRTYNENIRKYTEITQIQERSEKNCQMITATIDQSNKLLQNYNELQLNDSDKSLHITFDNKNIRAIESEIEQLEAKCLHSLNNNSNNNINRSQNTNITKNNNKDKHGVSTKIVTNKITLRSDTPHTYDNLVIKKGGIITVDEWNPSLRTGGVLWIVCQSLKLESGAIITVSGKGYKGATKDGFQGESYTGVGRSASRFCNNGGGGGGQILADIGGAGGGYGTNGSNGHCYHYESSQNSIGGYSYGDAKLSVIYLGSGGGAGKRNPGTNGGGAIIIECTKELIVEKGGIICANGGDTTSEYLAGCGSGGSIYLRARRIINDGKIEALGGRTGSKEINNGFGGFGRIRIDSNEKYLNEGVVLPAVGMFGQYFNHNNPFQVVLHNQKVH